MKTMQFLIDNICADFTVDSLLTLVRKYVSERPATIGDIAEAIKQKDRTLDIRCAEGLAEGAVQVLSESGDIKVRETLVYAAGSATHRR